MINPIQDSLVNLQKANQSLRNAVGTLPRNAVIVSAIVKNFEFNFTEYEESTFILTLDNNSSMEIPMWSFYMYMSDLDKNLSYYGNKYPEWEKLTEDLISLGYDFKKNLGLYIQQFSDEQMEDFTFSENDDFNFDDDDE
jgi:hypothetical protein